MGLDLARGAVKDGQILSEMMMPGSVCELGLDIAAGPIGGMAINGALRQAAKAGKFTQKAFDGSRAGRYCDDLLTQWHHQRMGYRNPHPTSSVGSDTVKPGGRVFERYTRPSLEKPYFSAQSTKTPDWQRAAFEAEQLGSASFPQGSVGAGKVWTIKSRIKANKLPTQGRIRFVPPDRYKPSTPLKKGPNGGILDRFDNEWVKGPSRTIGEAFEWDVQLSSVGKIQLGWASRDGSHLNVSLTGRITHR